MPGQAETYLEISKLKVTAHDHPMCMHRKQIAQQQLLQAAYLQIYIQLWSMQRIMMSHL